MKKLVTISGKIINNHLFQANTISLIPPRKKGELVSPVKYLTIISLVFLSLLVYGCVDAGGDDSIEVELPVSIMEIEPSYIAEYLDNTATVKAIREAIIKTEVSGAYFLQTNPSTEKKYAPGDSVKKGTLIIRLENAEHENTVKLESQKLNLNISKREYEKQQSLYEKGGVTLRELINSERTYVESRYTHNNALLQMQKLKIRAPFDGAIVSLPYYTPGGEVEVNQELMQIMDYSQLYADVNYPSNEIGRIVKGQKVQAMHYTLPADTLIGGVIHTSPAIDPSSRTFKAGVLIDNPGLKLRPGMFVKLKTIVAEADSVVVIPKKIILSKRRGKTVYIVKRKEANDRVITSGLENNTHVQIVEGLEFGDRLVIKGYETLRDHSKVKIVR